MIIISNLTGIFTVVYRTYFYLFTFMSIVTVGDKPGSTTKIRPSINYREKKRRQERELEQSPMETAYRPSLELILFGIFWTSLQYRLLPICYQIQIF